jgi:hypothetical protein
MSRAINWLFFFAASRFTSAAVSDVWDRHTAQCIQVHAITRNRIAVAEKLMTNDNYFSLHETVIYQLRYIFVPITAVSLAYTGLVPTSVCCYYSV